MPDAREEERQERKRKEATEEKKDTFEMLTKGKNAVSLARVA